MIIPSIQEDKRGDQTEPFIPVSAFSQYLPKGNFRGQLREYL